MKINYLEIMNFMGIKGKITLKMPHIAALIGPNGMGKTTILNALKFALTGLEPEGELIHQGCDQAEVTINLPNPADGMNYKFTRILQKDKPSKFKIADKTSTKKAIDQQIESIVGIPLDKIKVLSSAELVASMKPDEFSSFILDYIPEKLKAADIIAVVPETTLGMIEVMELNLPEEDVDLKALDDFLDFLKGERKSLKAVLNSKKTLAEENPVKEKPEGNIEELRKEYENVANRETAYKVYRAKKDGYDRAVAAIRRTDEQIEQTKKAMDAITVTKPDVNRIKALEDEKISIQDSLNNQKVAKNGAASGLRQLEMTLSALEKPICPISPLITCHENKSVAKQEVSESIESTRTGIDALEKEIAKLEARYSAVETELASLRDQTREYEKKMSLARQIKSLEDSKISMPAPPEEVTAEDFSVERFELEKAINAHKEYQEYLTLCQQVEQLSTEVNDYDRLVKLFSDKGFVRNEIISRYTKVFEDLCNERSARVRPEIDFKVVAENGVRILMNNGKGSYLPYSSLSGGEKAYMLFIIMDMLNALSGSNILMLDELSVVDTKCFEALLDIVLAYADDYDHIILAAVNHDDTVMSLYSRGLVDEHQTGNITFLTQNESGASVANDPASISEEEDEIGFNAPF